MILRPGRKAEDLFALTAIPGVFLLLLSFGVGPVVTLGVAFVYVVSLGVTKAVFIAAGKNSQVRHRR